MDDLNLIELIAVEGANVILKDLRAFLQEDVDKAQELQNKINLHTASIQEIMQFVIFDIGIAIKTENMAVILTKSAQKINPRCVEIVSNNCEKMVTNFINLSFETTSQLFTHFDATIPDIEQAQKIKESIISSFSKAANINYNGTNLNCASKLISLLENEFLYKTINNSHLSLKTKNKL